MQQSSYLLINEKPIQILPSLVKLIGLNEAIILQQIHSLLIDSKRLHTFHNHKACIDISLEELKKYFPFFSFITVKITIKNLQRINIIFSKFDVHGTDIFRKNGFSINYEELNKLQYQNK